MREGRPEQRLPLFWCLLLVGSWAAVVFWAPPGSAQDRRDRVPGQDRPAGLSLAQAQFEEGLRRLERRDLQGALRAFQAVLEADPVNAFAYYNIGLIELQFGRPDEATRSLREALRLKPDLLITYLHLGQMAESRGDSEAAQDAYLAVLLQARDRQSVEYRTASALLEAVEDRLEFQAALERGDARLKAGDFDGARQTYTAMLAMDPRDPVAHHNLAVVYGRQNRPDLAEGELRQAIAARPDYLEARLKLAQLYDATRQVRLARRQYETILHIDPARATAEALTGAEALSRLDQEARRAADVARPFLERGLERSLAGDLPGAVQEFQRVLRLDPENGLAYFHLGLLLTNLGNDPQAIEALRRAAELLPDDYPPHYRLARRLEAVGLRFEALKEFARTLALAPDPQLPEAQDATDGILRILIRHQEVLVEAQREFGRGREAQVRGRGSEAIQAFLRAASLLPEDPTAFYVLGTAYRANGRLPEAAAAMRRAVALKPDFFAAQFQLGLILEDQGLRTEAIRAFSSAVAAAVARDSPPAVEAAGRLLRLQTEEVAVRQAARHVKRGQRLSDRNNIVASRQEWREAAALQPANAFYRFKAATGAFLLGDLPAAVREFQAAASLDSFNPVYHHNLGLALQAGGWRAEAVREFETAARLKPDFRDPLFFLGVYHQDQGFWTEARRAYETVLTLTPDRTSLEYQLTRSRLDGLDRRMTPPSFSYGYSYNSNISNGIVAQDDTASTLSMSLSYFLIRRTLATMPLTLSTSQSTYYRAQFTSHGSSLSTNYSARLTPRYTLGLGWSLSMGITGDILKPTGTSQSFSLSLSRQGRRISNSLSLNRGQSFSGFNANLNTESTSLGVSGSGTLPWGDGLGLSFGLSDSDVRDQNLNTLSNSTSLSYSRTLLPGLTGSVSYSYTLTQYKNPDELALFLLNRRIRRENRTQNASIGLSYPLPGGLGVALGAGWAENLSNLPFAPLPEQIVRQLDPKLPIVGAIPAGTDYQARSVSGNVSWSF